MTRVLRRPGAGTDQAGRAGIARPDSPTAPAGAERTARRWNWIDEVLAESFPTSDPPSWTPGIARLAPGSSSRTALPSADHRLQTHDLLPHFEVTDLGGERVAYASIWQRKNLVLVMLPDPIPPSGGYVNRLRETVRGLDADDTEWIFTRDAIDGLPSPGVVVADHWGEIVYVGQSSKVEDLPPPEELLEWVRYVRHKCPECEGEAR